MTLAAIRTTLRQLAESLPPGTVVPVSREWVLELVGGGEESERVLITPDQAAARLAVSVQQLYRHRDWPFRVKISRRKLMIDAGKLAEWLAARKSA